jgi:hypothetical protein
MLSCVIPRLAALLSAGGKVNKLVKTIIDIYGQVGDFRVTPYDGAISISEADAQAEKAVEDYTKAVIREAIAALDQSK